MACLAQQRRIMEDQDAASTDWLPTAGPALRSADMEEGCADSLASLPREGPVLGMTALEKGVAAYMA